MEAIKSISSYILPIIVLCLGVIFIFGKRDYFSSFKAGATDGIKTAWGLLPTMCALSVSISIFSASGISDLFVKMLSPVCDFLKFLVKFSPLL